MATAPTSPNDLTRQQLDELDALLQRMLSSPIAPPDTAPPTSHLGSPFSPPPSTPLSPSPATPLSTPLATPVTPPVREALPALAETLATAPVPPPVRRLEHRPDQPNSANPVSAPQVFNLPVPEAAPVTHVPTGPLPGVPLSHSPSGHPPSTMPSGHPPSGMPLSAPLSRSSSPTPVVVPPQNPPTAPGVPTIPATAAASVAVAGTATPVPATPAAAAPTRFASRPASFLVPDPLARANRDAEPIPLVLAPFVFLNRVWNGVCGLFGWPGRLLRSGFVKNVLGLSGLGLIAYTALWLAQANGWVSLPVAVPWPAPWGIR